MTFNQHTATEIEIDMREWRNWQPRKVQNLVGEIPWEFKSPFSHQISFCAPVAKSVDARDLEFSWEQSRECSNHFGGTKNIQEDAMSQQDA